MILEGSEGHEGQSHSWASLILKVTSVKRYSKSNLIVDPLNFPKNSSLKALNITCRVENV